MLASVHDFEVLKSGYHHYLKYLLKQPHESTSLLNDVHSRFWAVLVDMGYIGPENATPDLCWYTPIKNPRNVIKEEYNCTFGKLCIHIECFFGKLVTTSGVLRGVYQWSHTHFDDNFTIGCCLVNERLSTSTLNQEDHQTFKGFLM